MHKAIKATLLSIFIFPGAGHFLLKQYITGTILVVTTLVALGLLMTKMVEIAVQIAGQIQTGEVQYDVATIVELISMKTTGGDAQLLNFATMVLLITWLVGIVDSYRVGRAQEKMSS
jgi:heme/copper-type cytochrome/quinol oxidase subunit 4